ncbi:Uncharacterised protein [Mycobacteroides abscessus subsp. abscessus]|nr:Uncharacterised protein [Mycobacteroides abscessus subsp. abscessus]
MGDFELVEKLLVGRRLFQWVQLCAVNVLQQRVTEEVVIRGLPHNCRDGIQARLLCGAPTPLPHHQLIVTVVDHAHHDRLHHAELTDRMNQLGQRFLIEHLAGLLGVRLDGGYWDLAVDRTDIGRWCGRRRCRGRATPDDYIGSGGTQTWPRRCRRTVHRGGGNERRQAATEAALTP